MTVKTCVCVTRRAIVTVAMVLGVSQIASAQGVGVRGGVSVNPDQGYLGAHFETGALVDRLHFRPNLEVGFGDNVTTTAVNLEFVYKFRAHRTPWRFYAGGGPAINLYHVEDNTDAQGGLNLLGGIEHENGFFLEFKAGAFDSPDLKVGIGYTFKTR